MNKPYITQAAIKGKDGITIFTLPRPARHHTILQEFYPNVSVEPQDQGFITDSGEWVTRWKAKRIAERAKQPFLDKCPKLDVLYSENLW